VKLPWEQARLAAWFRLPTCEGKEYGLIIGQAATSATVAGAVVIKRQPSPAVNHLGGNTSYRLDHLVVPLLLPSFGQAKDRILLRLALRRQSRCELPERRGLA